MERRVVPGDAKIHIPKAFDLYALVRHRVAVFVPGRAPHGVYLSRCCVFQPQTHSKTLGIVGTGGLFLLHGYIKSRCTAYGTMCNVEQHPATSRGESRMENTANAQAKPEQFTAIYEPIEDGWYFARCLEVPEAITQGETLEEARENIKDAIQLILEDRREDSLKELNGKDVIREPVGL